MKIKLEKIMCNKSGLKDEIKNRLKLIKSPRTKIKNQKNKN